LAYGSAPGSGAGRAFRTRSAIQDLANPSLKMPPGWPMSYRLPRNDMGAIAARCGGLVEATAIWLYPENEMPTMPTRPPLTQGCTPTVSTASYPS
jgi:hypothetical protein